jgi:hypothetical protein
MSGRGGSGASRKPGRRRRRVYGRKRFPKDREWIERRGRRKKGETKAEIKRALRKEVLAAIAHIAAYNAPGSKTERQGPLVKAIECLDRAIERRPGKHLLRKQRELCREERESSLAGRRGGTVEVVLDEADA